jgi:hypothetical protein
MRRQIALGVLALLAAAVMAYLLRDAIEQLVIRPLAFFWWELMLFYHAIPQQLFWIVLLAGMLLVFSTSLLRSRRGFTHRRKVLPAKGPVEALASWIEHGRRGVYFNWRIAKLLGSVAAYMLDYQERRLPGRKLVARDWNPPDEVGRYLDAGLNTTFADYPYRGWFSPPPSTPFDIDLEKVVKFMESELEITDDHDHP